MVLDRDQVYIDQDAAGPQAPTLREKLLWSLPWMSRYPFWRLRDSFERVTFPSEVQHLVFIVANHYEPAWNGKPDGLPLKQQISRVIEWRNEARITAAAIKDHDGMPFRHTHFYPAEQYHRPLLEILSEMQADHLGEVEIHLHHGVERPDTPENLRSTLEEFRDVLVEDHKCLSIAKGDTKPQYAFVHGNWALANSAGGQFCGVDSEMQILVDTGCYADFTLPAIHSKAQVPTINSIYECGRPLNTRTPHRTGPRIRVGSKPTLPVLIQGPTVLDWRRRKRGVPVPRIDDGILTASYPLDLARLAHWRNARVTVLGQHHWRFIKLHCHGFFQHDQDITIGGRMRRFLEQILEASERSGEFKVYFATAREAFNMVTAAVDGQKGEPGRYRNYLLHQIRSASATEPAETALEGLIGNDSRLRTTTAAR